MHSVALLTIISFSEGTPQDIPGDGEQALNDGEPYVQLLPEEGRLRIVAPGSGCRTRPVAYDDAAPQETLALLASPTALACTEQRTFTTTVVSLPPDREDTTVFLLDEVQAVLVQ